MSDMEVLHVNMFGTFSLTYKGEKLKLDNSSTTKMMQLLSLLLYYREGISRDKLLQYLYGDSDLVDMKNNLRVTVYRLRKSLVKAGLPDGEFVQIKSGKYRWNSEIPVYCDVNSFNQLLEEADQEEEAGNTDEAMQCRISACGLYKDEFLRLLSLEEWVAKEAVALKKKYFEALSKACDALKACGEFNSVLKLASDAAEIYPYDEWQMIQIDALIAMNRYDEAMDVYNQTTTQLFEDLGLPPTENMLRRYRAMSDEIEYSTRSAGEIVDDLSEIDDSPGAYFVSYPSFIDNYRMLQRISERSGDTYFLVVVTLIEKGGKPFDQANYSKNYSEIMKTTLQRSLRRTDTFTKYSSSQYLLLLVGLDQDAIPIVTNRIDQLLADISGSRRVTCRYRGIPVNRYALDYTPPKSVSWN